VTIAPSSACRVEGCDRHRYARGLCKPHHSRFMAHGDPEAGKPVRPGSARSCSVEGCERPYKGRGHCETHLVQLRKFGRTWRGRKPQERGAGR
jgi:hypothetical protein